MSLFAKFYAWALVGASLVGASLNASLVDLCGVVVIGKIWATQER